MDRLEEGLEDVGGKRHRLLGERADQAVLAHRAQGVHEDGRAQALGARTVAKLSADGTHYVLNGEKLWCTNGTRAK